MPPKPPARTTDRRRGAKVAKPIKKTTPYDDPFGRNEVPSSETNAMFQRIFKDRRNP